MAAAYSPSMQEGLVTNAARILSALDRRLDHEVTLVIYGRAAIALGFQNPPEAVTKTLDVDALIPVSQIARFRADLALWDAQEGTNRELEKDGLFITHLCEADQVFLRRHWEQHLVPINRPPMRWLRFQRSANRTMEPCEFGYCWRHFGSFYQLHRLTAIPKSFGRNQKGEVDGKCR